MSYNGSGTFLINTAGQPVVSGTVISSTAFNALTADLATGLSTAITKDGQTTVTANIPMGTYKFTGLGAGSAATDSANLSQVQSTVTKLLASVSGADTITAVASPTLGAYAAGQMFYFVAAGTNTGAVTLNIDSLGAKAVTRDGSTALTAGDLRSGEVIVVVYDGTRFQVVSQVNSGGDATFANVSITSALNVGGVATFTGGTANGVTYLNGSKALTSGAGLTYSGTNLAVTTGGINVTDSGGLNVGANTFFYGGNTDRLFSGTNAAQPFTFYTSGTERMRLDASGNLGLGVTPASFDSSVVKALQIGAQAAFAAESTVAHVLTNAYYNAAWKYIGTGNATDYYQLNGTHVWRTAASGTAGNTISWTQAMTLDASGNLGVGTTSPANIGAGYTHLEINNTTSGVLSVSVGGTRTLSLACSSSDARIESRVNGGSMQFFTNGGSVTERARITSGGKFLIATTDSAFAGNLIVQQATSASEVITVFNSATSGDNVFIKFFTDNGLGRGQIDYNRAGGAVRYNTTSDYRAKDVYGLVQDSGEQIDALKVYRGKMHGATQERPMMIAHEAQEVVPYAVGGEKDAVNEDGTPKYQTMDHQILVPLLIAEIQSLRTRVAQLEAK